MEPELKSLMAGATVAVEQCLRVRPEEYVVVICDQPCINVGRALWHASVEAGGEAILAQLTPRKNHGEEPPKTITELMMAADVIFAATSKSLTHTDARRAACSNGARAATLPNITEDVFRRTLVADYRAIAERSEKLARLLKGSKTMHLTSPEGTDLTLSLEGRDIKPDTGLSHSPGDMTNLPAGEAYFAPIEGSAEGVLVIDGSVGESGVLDEPIVMEIAGGYVVSLTGHPYSGVMTAEMDGVGRDARNVAEVGIGTNHAARLVGNVLEDEKILGTVHVAFGDNASMGGKIHAPYHVDGIVLNPVLSFDGKTVLEKGVLNLG